MDSTNGIKMRMENLDMPTKWSSKHVAPTEKEQYESKIRTIHYLQKTGAKLNQTEQAMIDQYELDQEKLMAKSIGKVTIVVK